MLSGTREILVRSTSNAAPRSDGAAGVTVRTTFRDAISSAAPARAEGFSSPYKEVLKTLPSTSISSRRENLPGLYLTSIRYLPLRFTVKVHRSLRRDRKSVV